MAADIRFIMNTAETDTHILTAERTGNAVANAGTNAIAMKKPKQGVYFVKVKVGSQSAVTRIMVR